MPSATGARRGTKKQKLSCLPSHVKTRHETDICNSVTALNDLGKKAFGGLLFLLLVMAALIFLPAWTLSYWQAWTFLAVFGASALAITLYLMKKDPKLLQRRVYAGPTAEKE